VYSQACNTVLNTVLGTVLSEVNTVPSTVLFFVVTVKNTVKNTVHHWRPLSFTVLGRLFCATSIATGRGRVGGRNNGHIERQKWH
jgi:hypothetical protein